MARLPRVGGDDGNWGDILNDYLSQSHAIDGTLKNNSVTSGALAPGSVTSAKIATNAVTSAAIADNAISGSSIANGSITEELLAEPVKDKLNSPSTIESGSLTEDKLHDDVKEKLNAAFTIDDGSLARAKLDTDVRASLEKADAAEGLYAKKGDEGRTDLGLGTAAQADTEDFEPAGAIAAAVSQATSVSFDATTRPDTDNRVLFVTEDDPAEVMAAGDYWLAPEPPQLVNTYNESWDGDDGSRWSMDWVMTTGVGTNVTKQNGKGRVVANNLYGSAYTLLANMPAQVDVDVAVDVTFLSQQAHDVKISINDDGTFGSPTAPRNGYLLTLSAKSTPSTAALIVGRYNNGTGTSLGSVASTITANQVYRVRFNRIGNTIRYKIWLAESGEPGTWTASYNDAATTIGAGKVGLIVHRLTDPVAETHFDNLVVTYGGSP